SYFSKNPDDVLAELTRIRDQGSLFVDKYDFLAKTAVWKGDARSAYTYVSKILDSAQEKKISREKALDLSIRRLQNANRVFAPDKVATIAERTLLRYGALTQFPKQVLKLKEFYALALYDAKNYSGA